MLPAPGYTGDTALFSSWCHATTGVTQWHVWDWPVSSKHFALCLEYLITETPLMINPMMFTTSLLYISCFCFHSVTAASQPQQTNEWGGHIKIFHHLIIRRPATFQWPNQKICFLIGKSQLVKNNYYDEPFCGHQRSHTGSWNHQAITGCCAVQVCQTKYSLASLHAIMMWCNIIRWPIVLFALYFLALKKCEMPGG